MKLANYANAIPKSLRVPDEKKSWMTLLRCVLLIFITQSLLYVLPMSFWYAPLYAVLIFLSGLSLVGLFVLVHDCGHYSFSKSTVVNDLVGFFAFTPMLNSFYAWRKAHDFHHRNNQVRKVDPDWPELLYTKEEKVPFHEKLAVRLGPGNFTGLLIGFWVGMLKRSFFSFLIPQMKMSAIEKLKLYALNALSAFFSIAFVYWYIELLGFTKFLLIFGGSVMIATTTGAFLTFIQHSHPGSFVFDKEHYDSVLSQIHSTVNVRFPRVFEWLWLDINIHLPHHVIAAVPWYNLRKANDELKRHFGNEVREVNFSFKMLQTCWKSTDLKTVREGVYVLAER